MPSSGDEGGDGGSLEELIQQSLRQNPSFSSKIKTKLPLRQRLVAKLPAISTAVAGGALSIPGNYIGTPIVVGGLTYLLADSSLKDWRRSKLSKKRTVGRETPPVQESISGVKPVFLIFSAALSVGMPLAFFTFDKDFSSSRYYQELIPYIPQLLSVLPYAMVNTLATYTALNKVERLFHPDSAKLMVARAKSAVYRLRGEKEKAAVSLEKIVSVPHSKEKEAAALLQLGDLYTKAGMTTEAVNAYKRMLVAARRKDESVGASDWLIGNAHKTKISSSRNDGLSYKVQAAMHDFMSGDYSEAHSVLTAAVAAEPENRQLHRIRALFFEATGNEKEADLEMRIYVELLRKDKSLAFKALGESRNEVLVPVDETQEMPDVYIKRSKNKASLDEEVRIITAFSELLPGKLPRVISQGVDGEYHYIVLESLGNSTMHRKALKGMLDYSDVKSVIDLLVDVAFAGARLEVEGKITVAEPITAEKYTYSDGSNQPNFSTWFTHRMTDIFASKVQKSNGVVLDDKFMTAFLPGAAVINETLFGNRAWNYVYTDFTPRNIIFSGLVGSLNGKIDWELVRKAPILIELVNVLEFYGLNLGPVAHAELKNYFLHQMEKQFPGRIDKKSFGILYEVAAVARHLELIGYMSRDAETNPEYNRAQVHNLLMAKIHLASVIRCAPPESKQPLEGMLTALDQTPILKDEELQRRLEQELRQQVMPPNTYLIHELSRKSYWKDFFRFSPRELFTPLRIKTEDFAPAIAGAVVVATLAGIAAYNAASYIIMSGIMPSLPHMP